MMALPSSFECYSSGLYGIKFEYKPGKTQVVEIKGPRNLALALLAPAPARIPALALTPEVK